MRLGMRVMIDNYIYILMRFFLRDRGQYWSNMIVLNALKSFWVFSLDIIYLIFGKTESVLNFKYIAIFD